MNKKKEIQVTAGVIMDGGRCLIARRPPHGSLAGKWEFPGGKTEPGESPRECLYRELKEEFEIETVVGDFIGERSCDYGDRIVHLSAFKAEYVGGEIKLNAHDRIAWVLPEKLDEYDFAEADFFIVDHLKAKR